MPPKTYRFGYAHHNKNISPTNENITSHDCVASTTESSLILFLVRSVALKNNKVAIIQDHIATIQDDNNCKLFGNPTE